MALTGTAAYLFAQGDIQSVASGFDHAVRTGDNTFSIFFIDGSQINLTIPLPDKGDTGVGVKDAIVDSNKHLIITLTDDSTVDAGKLPTSAVDISKATGNAIQQKPDGVFVDISGKIDIQQKATDKGKALIVGVDGKLTLGAVATSDIGSVELNMLGWNVPSELSLKNEVVGNKFIQKIARVDLGTLDWQYRSSDGLMLCQTPLESRAIAETDAPNIICSAYKALPRSGTESVANTDKSIALPNRYTIVHDSGFTDGTAYKTAIKGTYLYYELATPIEKVIEENEILTEVNDKIDDVYINGYASTNLLPYPYVGENALSGTRVEGGLTYTDNGDGSITIDGTSTGTSYIRLNVNGGIFGDISGSMVSDRGQLEIGEYTAIVAETKDNRLIVAYDPSRDLLAITSNGSGQVFNNEKFYPRVVKTNANDKSYNAYSKSNVDLTLEISHKELELAELKMLGWNVPKECPIQNEVSGNTFTQRVGRIDASTLSWVAPTDPLKPWFATTDPTDKENHTDFSTIANVCLVGYEATTRINFETAPNESICVAGLYVCLKDSNYTTADELKESLKGKYLYYELATPITTQIDGNEITAIEEESKFTTTHTVRNGQNYIKKVGKVCTVSLNIQLTSDQNAYTTIATIPNGFEPANQFFAVDADVNTGVLISNGKVVQFTKAQKSGDIVAFSATYVTN